MHVPRPVQQIIRICMGKRGAKHVRLGHPVCITLYTYLRCIQSGGEGASCERLGRLVCITISTYLLVICGGGAGGRVKLSHLVCITIDIFAMYWRWQEGGKACQVWPPCLFYNLHVCALYLRRGKEQGVSGWATLSA